MKYWLIYVDHFSSNEIITYDVACFDTELEANLFFDRLSNTEEIWFHKVVINGRSI